MRGVNLRQAAVAAKNVRSLNNKTARRVLLGGSTAVNCGTLSTHLQQVSVREGREIHTLTNESGLKNGDILAGANRSGHNNARDAVIGAGVMAFGGAVLLSTSSSTGMYTHSP